MAPTTKIEADQNKIRRTSGLDEWIGLLFPGKRLHQRIALAVLVELKWSTGQFLPSLDWLAKEYDFSRRSLETVRAKLRRLGVIDHVSRFNKTHGYREGWILSLRFEKSMERMGHWAATLRDASDPVQEAKDRDLHRYL